MIIVDAHVHIFEKIAGIFRGAPIQSANYGKVKIGNKIEQFLPPSFENSNSTVEILINYMNWCKVDKALLVPNIAYGYHNEYVYEAVNLYPDMFKAIALVDITKGAEAADELCSLIKDKSFSGLKIDTATAFQCMPGVMLDEKVLDPIWHCCNDLDLPVMFHLGRSEDIGALKKVVQRFKKIKYVICHLGSESVFHGDSISNKYFNTLIDMVLENSNMWIELSSIHAFYGQESYPFVNTCKLIEKIYSTLGYKKLLWGTDYPAILTFASYKQLVGYIIKGCIKIPEKHREIIMGANALNLFWDQ